MSSENHWPPSSTRTKWVFTRSGSDTSSRPFTTSCWKKKKYQISIRSSRKYWPTWMALLRSTRLLRQGKIAITSSALLKTNQLNKLLKILLMRGLRCRLWSHQVFRRPKKSTKNSSFSQASYRHTNKTLILTRKIIVKFSNVTLSTKTCCCRTSQKLIFVSSLICMNWLHILSS